MSLANTGNISYPTDAALHTWNILSRHGDLYLSKRRCSILQDGTGVGDGFTITDRGDEAGYKTICSFPMRRAGSADMCLLDCAGACHMSFSVVVNCSGRSRIWTPEGTVILLASTMRGLCWKGGAKKEYIHAFPTRKRGRCLRRI